MFSVTKAAITDLDDLAQLFECYRVFYKQPPDPRAAKTFIAARLENNDSEIFICRDNVRTAVGFVQLYPIFSSVRMRRLWLLNDLYTADSFRGKGIAGRLIEKAKGLCRQTEAAGIMLETAKDNREANNLYLKSNFSRDTAHNFYSWENDDLN